MADPDSCSSLARIPLLTSVTSSVSEITIYGMPLWAAILVIVILLFVSAIFSASENAFSNCDKFHFRAEAEKGSKTAKIVVKMTEKFENTLVSVLVGNNIVQTVMSSISALMFYYICQIYGLGDSVEAVLSTVVMAALVYIVSDTVPKILSKSMPNKMAVLLAWPDYIVSIILFPIIWLFKQILNAVHKILKIKEDDLLSKEDLVQKADEAVLETSLTNKEEELFEPEEVNMLKRALQLSSIKVSQVYTPLKDVVSIDEEDLVPKDLAEKLLDSPYSRLPVYREDKSDIVGILSVTVFFREYYEDKHLDPRSSLLKVVPIKESDDLLSAFETLNDEKTHMGIVVDEEGHNIGIITLYDILTELVVVEPKSNKAEAAQ